MGTEFVSQARVSAKGGYLSQILSSSWHPVSRRRLTKLTNKFLANQETNHSGWNIAQPAWMHHLAQSLRNVKVPKENGAVDPLMVRLRIASMLEDAAMLLASREVVVAKTLQHGVRSS